MRISRVICLFFVALFFGAQPLCGEAASAEDIQAYEAFRNQYGRSEQHGSSDYQQRLAFFIQRKSQVDAQNAKANKSWWAKVNKFTDMTDSEYRSMLGYRPGRAKFYGSKGSKSIMRFGGKSSFLEMDAIAEARDWRQLTSGGFLRVQGACGSCWAVAATGALEMHAEIVSKTNATKLSFSQLLDCTPNPAHCGGDGGCSGATAELAFEFAQKHGIASEANYADSDSDGKCVTTPAALRPTGFVPWILILRCSYESDCSNCS